jgi:3alpha(or 20beta)-hydroxysteroid dehydrogenase
VFSLNGKAALVTGAASGIGLAVARRFQAAGARVAAADLNDRPELKESGISFIRTDVRDEDQVAATISQAAAALGGLDILVNNAGVAGAFVRLTDHPADDIENTVATNLLGVLWGLRHAPAHLNDGGSIINTASICGLLGTPLAGVYSMTKAGVISLTRTTSHELGHRAIRVNAVCPGTIVTPMEPADGEEAQLAPLVTALGRPGSVDDVVGVYHFLASDESRFVTGQAIAVDGGWSAGWSEQAWDHLVAAGRADPASQLPTAVAAAETFSAGRG